MKLAADKGLTDFPKNPRRPPPGEVLRVDSHDKAFDRSDSDAGGLLFKLKSAGKQSATLFRNFKTLSGKIEQGEL